MHLRIDPRTTYAVHLVGFPDPQLRRLHEDELAIYRAPVEEPCGEPDPLIVRTRDGHRHRIIYSDDTVFVIDRSRREVVVYHNRKYSRAYIETYLLGPILGYIVYLHEVTTLHASAVASGDLALAFAGCSGAGKSTTAAAFALRGLPVLSDDIVPLQFDGERVIAMPSYPQLRLWDTSVAMFYGRPDALPLLAPDWDKRGLDLTQPSFVFQSEPLPLGAIYVFDERRPGLTAPLFESISKREALILLTANTYAAHLLEKPMRALEFERLHAVVERVPVRRLIPPADPAYVGALCDGILDDARAAAASIERSP